MDMGARMAESNQSECLLDRRNLLKGMGVGAVGLAGTGLTEGRTQVGPSIDYAAVGYWGVLGDNFEEAEDIGGNQTIDLKLEISGLEGPWGWTAHFIREGGGRENFLTKTHDLWYEDTESDMTVSYKGHTVIGWPGDSYEMYVVAYDIGQGGVDMSDPWRFRKD